MALAPWEAYTPEALAEWETQFGTANEEEANKARIGQAGLTAMVTLQEGEEWNGRSLWMLVLEPVNGRWTHMRKPESLEEKLREAPYHISIIFNNEIQTTIQQQALQYLKDNYTEPFEYTFWISGWGNGQTAVMRQDRIWEDVNALHRTGSYANRGPIHISM